jgi:hypothetical protein
MYSAKLFQAIGFHRMTVLTLVWPLHSPGPSPQGGDSLGRFLPTAVNGL